MITNIILIFYTMLLTAAISYIIILRQRRDNNIKTIAQLFIDIEAYKDQINKLVAKQDVKSVEQTDGFLRFVSQSRDWAFEYIQDAQEKINAFDNELNSIINNGGNKKETVKLILEAYKPIKGLLPDEQGEK